MARKPNPEFLKEMILKNVNATIETQIDKNLLNPEITPPVDVSRYTAMETRRVALVKKLHFLKSDEIIETKRYNRFVDRIKDDCFGFVLNLLMSDCTDYDGELMKRESFDYLNSFQLQDWILAKASSIVFTDFKDHILNTRFEYYLLNFTNCTDIEMSYGVPYFTNMATISELTAEQNPHLWDLLIETPDSLIEGIEETGYEICNYELENAINNFILKYGVDDLVTISKENYTAKITTSRLDIMEILQETLCRVIGHVYGVFAEIGEGSNLETLSGMNKRISEIQEVMSSYEDTITQMDEKIEGLNDIIAEKDIAIRRLMEKNDKDKKMYSEEIKRLQKEIKKLKHDNKELSSQKVIKGSKKVKSEDVQEKPVEAIAVKKEVEKEIPKCDVNLRYVFIVGDSVNQNLLNRIEEEFPNSKLEDSTRIINAKDVDLVVMLTEYIPHRLAYSYKNQCASKGIKYIYTNKTNIEQIKTDIATQLTTEG